ncbi:Tn3 family transposase [Streptomyces sp. NPDC001514]
MSTGLGGNPIHGRVVLLSLGGTGSQGSSTAATTSISTSFRELGRAVRTITLLRYLSNPDLREQITQVTNRNEAFHGFADWLVFGGKLIGHNDPDYQEKIIKSNPYLTHVIRRLGNWVLNLSPPAATPTTHLDLESRVLFAP